MGRGCVRNFREHTPYHDQAAITRLALVLQNLSVDVNFSLTHDFCFDFVLITRIT